MNNFLKATSDIEIEARKKFEDILREYLISIGGSLDVKFKKLSVSVDTEMNERASSIKISRIFVDTSSNKKDIYVTCGYNDKDSLLADFLTLNDIIALMYHIAELIDDNAPSV